MFLVSSSLGELFPVLPSPSLLRQPYLPYLRSEACFYASEDLASEVFLFHSKRAGTKEPGLLKACESLVHLPVNCVLIFLRRRSAHGTSEQGP